MFTPVRNRSSGPLRPQAAAAELSNLKSALEASEEQIKLLSLAQKDVKAELVDVHKHLDNATDLLNKERDKVAQLEQQIDQQQSVILQNEKGDQTKAMAVEARISQLEQEVEELSAANERLQATSMAHRRKAEAAYEQISEIRMRLEKAEGLRDSYFEGLAPLQDQLLAGTLNKVHIMPFRLTPEDAGTGFLVEDVNQVPLRIANMIIQDITVDGKQDVKKLEGRLNQMRYAVAQSGGSVTTAFYHVGILDGLINLINSENLSEEAAVTILKMKDVLMDLAVSECARVCVETLPIDPIGQVIGRIGDRKARWVLKNNATVERFEQAFLQKVGQDVKAELGAEDCEKYFIQPLANLGITMDLEEEGAAAF